MGFNSKTLGREITADHLQDINDHEVITNLWFEVGDTLSSINAELLRTPRHINQGLNPQHESLSRMRAFLAPFHQRVAHRKAQLRDASDVPAPIRGESPHSDAFANVPSIESLYYTTARKELDPATHQRLLLIAEQRRHSHIARVTGLAMGR
jgi:hypothetical protein